MTETVRLSRDYPASPERVFAAWTQVELLRKSFGCGPDMLWTVHTWEARVGGAIFVSLTFDHDRSRSAGSFSSSIRRAASSIDSESRP